MVNYEELTNQFKAKVPLFEQLREEASYALSQAIQYPGSNIIYSLKSYQIAIFANKCFLPTVTGFK